MENVINQLISEFQGHVESELMISEGERQDYYLDSRGIRTIGMGHNCVVKPLPADWKTPITYEQEVLLLRQDIEAATRNLYSYIPWTKLIAEDARKGILIDLSFNLGIGRLLLFHKMLGDFKDGYFNDAAMELMHSEYANQVPARCKRLADQMVSNQWGTAIPMA